MELRGDRHVSKLEKAADVDGLIQILADLSQPPFARQRAARALGDLRATAAVDALIVALYDSEVRAIAALALGSIGDLRAVGAVSRLLSSNCPAIQQSGARALADLDQASAGHLESALQAYRAERAAGARRLAERIETPVATWSDCPLCSRVLAKRKHHAVQCQHCLAYFTDEHTAPRVSKKPTTYGLLLGSDDIGRHSWRAWRDILANIDDRYRECSPIARQLPVGRHFDSLADDSVIAWRLDPADESHYFDNAAPGSVDAFSGRWPEAPPIKSLRESERLKVTAPDPRTRSNPVLVFDIDLMREALRMMDGSR
jgi:hypothetical protein